jgi:cell division inhibitor SulA
MSRLPIRERPISQRLEELSRTLQESGIRGRVKIGIPRGLDAPLSAAANPRRSWPDPSSADPSSSDPSSSDPSWEALLRPLRERSALVEITGPLSCGRTALAYRAALDASQRGGWIGWIDPGDALDPRFAERAGIPLERLLWVRPTDLSAALRAAEIALKAGFLLVVLDLVQADRRALARLGSAVWVRLQRAARRARASLLVLGPQGPLAGSFATARLEAQRTSSCFERGLFEGYAVSAAWARDRAGLVPPPHSLRVEHRSLVR